MNRIIQTVMFVIVILLCPLTIHAATLQGEIYDYQLKPLTQVLVEIDTTPAQQILSTDGSYSFTLLPGIYTLTARQADLETIEEIRITTEQGTFQYDLFLFPSLSDEDELFSDLNGLELDSSVSEEEISNRTLLWIWKIAAATVIIGCLGLLVLQQKKKPKATNSVELSTKTKAPETIITTHVPSEDSQLLEKVISLLKTNDGRMSQRDLRKELAYLSESKVSLLITELEYKQKISKVKRGRGNVILLK